MDTDVLVENKINDGESLIRQLIREQFGVEVAFWVKTSEEGLWQLWIASPAADPRNLGEALGKVRFSMRTEAASPIRSCPAASVNVFAEPPLIIVYGCLVAMSAITPGAIFFEGPSNR